MRKIILFLIAGFFLLACSEEKITDYSSVDRIYFNNANIDSVAINLKALDAPVYVDDTIIGLPVRLMGYFADIDRAFTAQALDSSSAKANQYFEILPSYIPAISNVGLLNIKLKNSDTLKNGDTLVLYVKLLPNELFSTDYSEDIATGKDYNNLCFRVYFYANLNIPPRIWYVGTDNGTNRNQGLGPYLGLFDNTWVRRFEVFCAATGIPASAFEFSDQDLIDETGLTVVNRNNANKLFETRFGNLREITSRWQSVIAYYLSVHPEIEQLTWGPAWGKLN